MRLYTDAACAGTAVATGSAADLAAPGIALAVADDTVTVIRATATDEAGNASACSAELTYVEDSTPPDTIITAGPEGITGTTTPTFEFQSSEPASSFECRVDAAPFGGCASPVTVGPLGNGPHTFEVRAADAAGNTDPSPAARSFTIPDDPGDPTAEATARIERLRQAVKDMDVPSGTRRSLGAKLEAARDALADGHVDTACNVLHAFGNQARAQTGHHLSPTQGAQLIAEAQEVRRSLACR